MMVVLFTDFGTQGLYVGQLHMTLEKLAPDATVIDICHDVPNYNVQAAAYLLAALTPRFPERAICVGVVDPGVGGPREPIMVRADGRWFVGPDNGLFAIVLRRARDVTIRRIDWRPAELSNSFHGRDLFVPVAAMLAQGVAPAPSSEHTPMDTGHWPDDLARVIYIDHYGNAVTGLRATKTAITTVLEAGGVRLPYARTFGDATIGTPFWYINSLGLVEIAVNRGHAADQLELEVGDALRLT